jgi:2'-5' RNA ligase
MKLRTFIALELDETHKQAINEFLNVWSRTYNKNINWVKPENLHLTLLFIGDTESGDVANIKDILFEKTLRTGSFELNCLGFELFPAVSPRLLWVKLEARDKGIFAFAKDLNRAVKELGYEPDAKGLKLHITVGRIKAPQPVWIEEEFLRAELPNTTALYDTVTLYQSILKPDGPVYTPLEQFTLQRHAK